MYGAVHFRQSSRVAYDDDKEHGCTHHRVPERATTLSELVKDTWARTRMRINPRAGPRIKRITSSSIRWGVAQPREPVQRHERHSSECGLNSQ